MRARFTKRPLQSKPGAPTPPSHNKKRGGEVTETESKRRPRILHWNPPLVLDGAPFTSNSSIQNFDNERASYIANFVEQALMLPLDMAELHNLKKHGMFLSLKRDLALGFYLKTWIASVDQSLELRDPRKVFYPLAIRVKVAALVTSSTVPSASLASDETSGPTPSDKTLTAPLTSFEKEGPNQDKAVPNAPNHLLKARPPKWLRRTTNQRSKGKSWQSRTKLMKIFILVLYFYVFFSLTIFATFE
nr:hypothetical protein CFP56_47048 [Quercus suber]